jgi:tetratricopeptide (TPR) repeat protein
VQRAEAWTLTHDDDRAIADYSEAIRLDPKNASANYVKRGYMWRRKGDLDRAIADDSEAIRLDPKNDNAFNSRGVAYAMKKDYDRAIQDYDEAIRLKPANIIFGNRARAYEAKKQYNRALTEYDDIFRFSPNDSVGAAALDGRCLVRVILSDLNTALTDCNESIRLFPTSQAYGSRALVYLKLGDFDKAIADYDYAIKRDPKLARSLYGRGVAKQKKADSAGGNADIAAAKAITPEIADEFARYFNP